ncbi:MAG: hypothetical protein IJ462_02760 [Clostridia bacterium]|nr:hypothetical protein [Clostridia bacterium]
MKNLKLFFKSFLGVIIAVAFIAVFTVSAAIVDTNTRRTAFGEGDPALAVEEFKDYTKIYFFGSQIIVYDETVENIKNTATDLFDASLPSPVKLLRSITEKIKDGR